MKQYIQTTKQFWKLLLLFLLLAITFSYAMFQGGFVSWYLFYSFLPFAVYALAIAIYPLREFKAERIISQLELNAGEKVNITLSFKRTRRFPLLYLIVEEQFADSQLLTDKSQAKKMVFPGVNRKFTIQYSIDQLPRGEHSFIGIRVKTGDLFGLFEKEVSLPLEGKILVYPAYKEIAYHPQESRFDQGSAVANERIQKDTSMSVGVREYQPGDRFSWINWKATAKRNEFMTKEFEQRRSHDVLIIMDCVPTASFETVVMYTASMIRSIIQKGAQVGLLTYSGERTLIPVHGGHNHQQLLFAHLAKIKSQSTIPFSQMLEQENFQGRQYNDFMLVTAELTENLVKKAAFYANRNGQVTLFFIKKEKASLSELERNLIASARSRRVIVTIVHEKQFAKTFVEGNRG
ncbi:DUF58 domain-containing protein [Mesobacillus maritimus]|uniref:DUF58 domain-containing protein n=1 Tax=Mesobacillus maritimus TaxID=1643336 RepID=UPI00203E6504|nr:DUF58 domain-containing protein [Mesobacillus maritimus]MCM3671918.1 DUF58 domain-containing protein [Mesobacillus maritimus]